MQMLHIRLDPGWNSEIKVWAPAYDAHDQVRDGAWVAELTDLLNLTGWPAGMRVIARKERPHPGAQLRITDIDGHRVTAFATNTTTGGRSGGRSAGKGPGIWRQRRRSDPPSGGGSG